MTIILGFLSFQMAVITTSAAAFSSVCRSSTSFSIKRRQGASSCLRHMNMNSNNSFGGESYGDQDSTMNSLSAALQQLEMKTTAAEPPSVTHVNHNHPHSNVQEHGSNIRDPNMPVQDQDGIYQIQSKEQHAAFLKANPDKLVVMKFTAGYCRACAALKPKFKAVMDDASLKGMPIVWADFKASPHTKAVFRRLNVLALPTIHFYDGVFGLEENFQCGPANIDRLTQKLFQFIAHRVNPETLQLKEPTFRGDGTDAPARVREVRIGDELITQEHLDYLRDELPFFEELTEQEFVELLSKASLQTFLPGDVVIRQGNPGNAFYVVKSGLLEMSIKSRFDDPIATPPSYLGAVVNTLTKFDYFGERALTTGQPLAASVRAVEKSRCFVFNVEDIPEASILSQKRRATRALVDKLTERYELPADYQPWQYYYAPTEKDESILELLVRFKQIRQAAKCFDYFIKQEPLLGDKGEIIRRSILVSKLSESQRQDIVDVFNMADVYGKGTISLLELRRFMERARKKSTDNELMALINKANPSADQTSFGTGITLDEFMGIMAEAEFYYLFTETFQELDKDQTGYVRAGDLDEVLDGVRDLISDDRKSIIDVEDQDVQIDYEQFAKMLLGAAL